MLDVVQLDEYRKDGFLIVRGLFPVSEVDALIDHYMKLRLGGAYPGDYKGNTADPNDPWAKYPRMIHMHRWDQVSLRWLTDARIGRVIQDLTGEEPMAVQTMLYFKPPGARGQAMHQDNFYLVAKPGTCIAAWLALDDCDEQNGALRLVPGSHNLPLLCTGHADVNESFTNTAIPLPPEVKPVTALTKRGDVLFFHGSVIHGSGRNSTADRFRRSLIGHYVTGNATTVAKFYHPVLKMDGTEIALGASERGGPCGAWVNRDGTPVVELTGKFES